MKLNPPFELWQEQIHAPLPAAHAMFTTRRGGVSTGRYASLNLGRLTDDDPEAVGRNRRRVEALVGRALVTVRQVHGTAVKRVTVTPHPGDPAEDGDGQVTRLSDVATTVLVADCLPIIVAGGGGVAALHAGWRGLADGIVGEGVAGLRELGCDGELAAAIGPGARACCYEVGEEVHERFAAYEDAVRRGSNLDLAAVARRALESAGVQEIYDVGLCTICGDEDWFFSHRRDDGVTGRQAGIGWLS